MRAFFGVFFAFFALIALFLRPLSNYYEAKYQKDFFISDERAMALSDKFIGSAEQCAQSVKDATRKFTQAFYASFGGLKHDKSVANKQTSVAKTERNSSAPVTPPANLTARNSQNLSPALSAQKEANLTTRTAQISPAALPLNLDANGSAAQNSLDLKATAQTDKTTPFDIKLNENLGVILIGDSIMQGFGWGFENTLKTRKITIKNMAKASTGLTNKKFYDWGEELKTALANLKDRPQNLLILALFGANDAYSYTFDDKTLSFGTQAWREAYEGRIAEIYEIAQGYGARVVWLGMPCMKSEKFDKKMKALNLIYKDAAQKYGARYIDIGGAICEGGKFIKTDANKKSLRNDDGVHISMNGAKKIAVYVVDKLLNEQNGKFN